MTLALEIAFAASLGIVAASLVGVVFARIPERVLLGASVGLAVAALAAAVLAGIVIVEGNGNEEVLIVATGGRPSRAATPRGWRRIDDLRPPPQPHPPPLRASTTARRRS